MQDSAITVTPSQVVKRQVFRLISFLSVISMQLIACPVVPLCFCHSNSTSFFWVALPSMPLPSALKRAFFPCRSVRSFFCPFGTVVSVLLLRRNDHDHDNFAWSSNHCHEKALWAIIALTSSRRLNLVTVINWNTKSFCCVVTMHFFQLWIHSKGSGFAQSSPACPRGCQSWTHLICFWASFFRLRTFRTNDLLPAITRSIRR